MAQKISFDFGNTAYKAGEADIEAIKDRVIAARNTLIEKTGAGNDFIRERTGNREQANKGKMNQTEQNNSVLSLLFLLFELS